jgi:hypothetical protein
MSIVHKIGFIGLIAASSLAIGAAANAAEAKVTPNGMGDSTSASPDKAHQCFYLSQWENWRAPNPDVIYMRVRVNDIYRVDLSHGSSLLLDPFVHLVSTEHGDDAVCDPIDLQLSVSENGALREPLFVKAITKLTPDQVAAIPKKYLP